MSVINFSPTTGSWLVLVAGKKPDHLVIKVDETNNVIACIFPDKDGQPNWADAALMCASKSMLEALIAIQETLMSSKDVIDLEAMNDLISQTFEKIAAECG